MRIYVSGPMRGKPKLNLPAFDAASERLRLMGYDVVNPADISRQMLSDRGLSKQSDISDIEYIKADLAALETCDAIVLLPGWFKSKGVAVEIAFAKYLDLKVYRSIEALIAARMLAA